MAVDALQFHIEGMLEEGLPIPPPSTLTSIMADPENAEAIPFPVTVPGRRPKGVRINMTMPEAELEAIDEHAKRLGLTRSAFLAWAAKHAMRRDGKDHAA